MDDYSDGVKYVVIMSLGMLTGVAGMSLYIYWFGLPF